MKRTRITILVAVIIILAAAIKTAVSDRVRISRATAAAAMADSL